MTSNCNERDFDRDPQDLEMQASYQASYQEAVETTQREVFRDQSFESFVYTHTQAVQEGYRGTAEDFETDLQCVAGCLSGFARQLR